jgi:CheY-like chemotaxis protein
MIETIGVIDDDEIFLMLATFTLKNSFPDAKYFTAKNGEEALQQLDKLTPTLLFLDLNMPVMNGWEFLDQLKKIKDTIAFPIYITTSSVDPEDKQKAESHSFVKGFIEKPLSLEKLESLGLIK